MPLLSTKASPDFKKVVKSQESLSTEAPIFYDRPITTVTDSYDGITIAPHASTIRFTIPSSTTKFLFLNLQLQIIRATAASVLGLASIGLLDNAVQIFRAAIFDNTIGAKDTLTLQNFYVREGLEDFDIRSFDLSTGGTIYYFAGFIGFQVNKA